MITEKTILTCICDVCKKEVPNQQYLCDFSFCYSCIEGDVAIAERTHRGDICPDCGAKFEKLLYELQNEKSQ